MSNKSSDELITTQADVEPVSVSKPNSPKRDGRRRLSLEEKTLLKQMRKQKADFYQRIRQLTGPSNDEQYLKNRHEIIQEIVAHLGHTMNVFDSQRSANEWLTDASMNSLPIFWFKMHHWQPDDIRFLYDCVGNPRINLEDEIEKCYSGMDLKPKVKSKGKQIRKDSKLYLKQQQISIRNKHDRNSSRLLSERQQSAALGAQIWDRFVQSRGGALECTSINEDQWNIALNDNGIEVSPDLSLDLYLALLDAKEKMDQQQSQESSVICSEHTKEGSLNTNDNVKQMEKKKEGEKANENEEREKMSLEEKKAKVAVEKARMKRAATNEMTMDHFKAMMSLIREEYSKNKKLKLAKAKAKEIMKLKDEQQNSYLQNIVLCQKVFDAIIRGEKLDVQATYLTDKLTSEELDDYQFILKELSSRNADWRRRLDILTYVEEHLDEYEYCNHLISDDNVQPFVFAWTAQILDDRSHLSQTACRLFPSVVTSIIGRKETAACFFEQSLLDAIFLALFTVVRGKRAPELCKIGEIAAIQILDILANVAEGVEEEDMHIRAKSHSVVLSENVLEQLSREQKDQKFNSKRNVHHGRVLTESTIQCKSSPRSPNETDMVMRNENDNRNSVGRIRSPTIDRLAKLYEVSSEPQKSCTESLNAISPTMTRTTSLTIHRNRRKIDKSFVTSKIRMSKDSYNMLLRLLIDHSTYANEKHESVRAICQILLGYMLYGVEQKHLDSEGGYSKTAFDEFVVGEDTNHKDNLTNKHTIENTQQTEFGFKSVKINTMPARAFLLDIEAFRIQIKHILGQGVDDRAESVRAHAMKLLQKLETTFGHQNLEKWFDNDTLYRYTKWMKRQECANRGKSNKTNSSSNAQNSRRARMNIAEMKALARKKKLEEEEQHKKSNEEILVKENIEGERIDIEQTKTEISTEISFQDTSAVNECAPIKTNSDNLLTELTQNKHEENITEDFPNVTQIAKTVERVD